MNGSSTSNQNGAYNTQGYPGNNSPGSRTEGVSFTSPDGRMWLFGGYGYSTSGQGVGKKNRKNFLLIFLRSFKRFMVL